MRLLMVHAEKAAYAPLATALREAGFDADVFERLAEAGEALRQNAPQAVYGAALLDRAVRDGTSASWLRKQREAGLKLPVIVLTPSVDVEERVLILDAGADDCVVRPVAPRELVARVRAVLRRPAAVVGTVLQAGNLRLDTTSREVSVAGRPVPVPRRELSLLEHLVRRVGRVVPRSVLEGDVYGHAEDVAPNSIEVRISRVRRHLAQAGATLAIQTVRGVGYMLAVAEAPVQAAPTLPPPVGPARPAPGRDRAAG